MAPFPFKVLDIMATARNESEQGDKEDEQNIVLMLKHMLIHAIILDEMENFVIIIETLKQLNIDLNWTAKMKKPLAFHGREFYSPLGYAISLGRSSMMGMLLANAADPNLCGKDEDRRPNERTALHVATGFRKPDILNFLLQRGDCDINKQDASGWTALNLAIALEEEAGMAMKLLAFGANPKERLTVLSKDITRASRRYSLHSVLHRYDWCLTPPSQFHLNSLHLAAHCHQPEVVAKLASEHFSGDDINLLSSLGTTPLHEAVVLPENYDTKDMKKAERRLKTMEILLQSGVSPNLGDNIGRTPLHLFLDEVNSMKVVVRANLKMVTETLQLLLQHKADPNLQDKNGRTLAHQVAVFGNVDILKLVLEAGGNCTRKDGDGNTPAHVAAYHGKFEVLSFLVQSGNFLTNETNNIGESVFHAVVKAKRDDAKMAEMARLLQKYCDVNRVNVFGESVCDLILKFRLDNVAKYLSECCNDERENRVCSSQEYGEQSKEKQKEAHVMVETREDCPEGDLCKESDKVSSAIKRLKLKIDEETDVTEYLLELCEKNKMGEIHLETDRYCHERCEIAKQTKSFVQELLNLIGNDDERFASNVLCTGSAFEGYRISKPDEFDYMCELVSLSNGACEVLDSEVPGFVRIQVRDEHRKDWQMFTSEDGLLDSSKIRSYLGETLQERSKSMRVSQRFKLIFNETSYDKCKFCQPLIKLSKAGIKMAVIWNGTAYPMMLIDIDVTPSIHFAGWPKSSKVPSSRVLRNCEDVGYHVVPKTEGNNPLLWRLSFSKAELEILRNVSDMQGICYTSLKIIKDTTLGLSLREFSHLGNLHTYMLKTKFFEELEKSPDARLWSKNELVDRICSIFESIARHLSQKGHSIVESFFLPGYNVISGKDTMHAGLISASIKETLLRIIKLLKKETFIKPVTDQRSGFQMHFRLEKEEGEECGSDVIFD